MIRRPALVRTPRGLKDSSSFTLPAPIGGWNARDPIANMRATDAIVMENWFPMAADVQLRPGSRPTVTGFGQQVRTLITWNSPAVESLFACTNSGIYSATLEGAVGAAVTSLTNGIVDSVNFPVAGGHYLVLVNGTDKLKLYNGTTWQAIDGTTTPAITGRPTTSLIGVAVIRRRLWFVEKLSMSAWYLPVAQVGGALTEFPLGQVFPRGGRLVAIASWTIDGGDGSDDYTVFASSQGEVAVYKGTDPDSADTWSKVGTYYIGEPLGSNCFCKFGGDLLFLSRAGLFPLSKALLSATIDRRQALTSKIDAAFSEAISFYGDNTGWKAVLYPEGSFLLVNVPIAIGYSHQYVMNVTTGAWAKFIGMSANDWAVFRGRLYFAATASVGLAWTGRHDYGKAIVGRVQQAFTALGRPSVQKHVELLRLSLTIEGKLTLQLGLDADYKSADFASVSFSNNRPAAIWDTSRWDNAVWGAGEEPHQDWSTIFAPELYVAALRIQCSTATAGVRWAATDFIFRTGGLL